MGDPWDSELVDMGSFLRSRRLSEDGEPDPAMMDTLIHRMENSAAKRWSTLQTLSESLNVDVDKILGLDQVAEDEDELPQFEQSEKITIDVVLRDLTDKGEHIGKLFFALAEGMIVLILKSC